MCGLHPGLSRFAPVGALVVLLLAGCGGGGSGSASNGYTLSATRSCLDKAGFRTAPVENRFLPGAGGSLRVHVSEAGPGAFDPNQQTGRVQRGYVFLVFARNQAGALALRKKALDLAEQSFEHQGALMTRAALKKGVGLSGNVFFYSATGALSRGDRSTVTSCLR